MSSWPYAALHDADGTMLLPLTVNGPPADPFLVTAIDLGAVDIREDVTDNPAGDGTDDFTMFSGGSAVTVELTALGTSEAGAYLWLDKLIALCQPATRCYLHVRALDWPAIRRILIRGASAPRALTDPQPDVQFGWKAPDGWLEAVDETEAVLQPLTVSAPGLAAPWTAPISTPPSSAGGLAPFTVGGSRDTWPTFDIYDCTGPVLTNAAGQQIAFESDFVVPPGHFLRIEPKASGRSVVTLDGDPDLSYYAQLDFSVSSWWPLTPGDNQISLSAAAFGPACHALVRWRDRW